MDGNELLDTTGTAAILTLVVIQAIKAALFSSEEDPRRKYLPLMAMICGVGATIAVVAGGLAGDGDWNWAAVGVYGALNGATASGLHSVLHKTQEASYASPSILPARRGRASLPRTDE